MLDQLGNDMMNPQRPTRWYCLLAVALIALTTGVEAQTDLTPCLTAVQNSDISYDNRLSKDEYVLLLNELTQNEYRFTSYDELPDALLMNFEIYQESGRESGAVIDIRGAALGGNATRRQKRIVETLCETTPMAIAAVSWTSNSTAPSNSTTGNATDSVVTVYTYPYPIETSSTLESQNMTSANVTVNTTGEVSTSNHSSAFSLVSNVTGNVTRTEAIAQHETQNTSTAQNNFTAQNTTNFTASSDAPSNETQRSFAPTTAPSIIETSKPSAFSTSPTVAPSAVNVTSPAAGVTNTSASPYEINSTSPENGSNDTETYFYSFSPTFTPSTDAAAPNSTWIPASNSTNAANETETSSETAPSPSPSPSDDPLSVCKKVMRFSDVDADGMLNKMEYVWFLNDNWDNLYPGVDFQDLPQSLKDNFNGFAMDGVIDIAVLNSEDPMSEDQEEFLDGICSSTEAVISSAGGENAGEEASMATFEYCLEFVTAVDENGDSWIEAPEYTSLINELSKGSFGGGGSFEDLPSVLQESFNDLSISAAIDLGGALPGTNLSSSQQEIIENFCVETSFALEEAAKSIGEGNTFDTTDTSTMLEYAACFMGMNDRDRNQDQKLDADEYIGLVNLMGKERFQDLDFAQLPLVLQDNFINLQTNDTINIEGSQEGQMAGRAQQQLLERVCVETTAAVNMAIAMGIDVSSTPAVLANETAEVSIQEEPLVIHSAFNIYSDVWIADEEFIMGPTRFNLEEAYRQFVMEVVDGLKHENDQRRKERWLQGSISRQDGTLAQAIIQRPLAVLDRDSPSIDQIVDLSCAGGTDGATCKTVYASYKISPLEEDMDKEGLYDEYVRVTQSFIDGGILQGSLQQVDPNTSISVIGASDPVVFTSEVPSQAPVESIPFYSDKGSEERTETSKKKTIAIIAVAVGGLLVASLIGLVVVRYRKEKTAAALSTASSSNGDRFSDGKASETVSNKEDEFQLEGSLGGRSGSGNGSTGSGHSSRIFRSRLGGESDSDDDVLRDEELGKMQVIELSAGSDGNVVINDFEANSPANILRNLGRQTPFSASLPPIRKKNDEASSAASAEMSFEFRRFSLGDGKEQQPPKQLFGI
jgi:hypothetical protein